MRRLLRAALPLIPWLCLTGGAVARDLTFEERVKVQEAIERVYYSHQIGATKPFQQAVPHSILEQKVRSYLKESVALERVWLTPITPAMLHMEMERIVRDTRMPDRLQEIFAALGYDSFVIEECLARAILTSRLTRSLFTMDGQIHAAARAEALELQSRLARGLLSTASDDSRRDIVEVYQTPPTDPTHRAVDPVGIEPRPSGLSRLRVTAGEYETWRSRAPKRIGEIGRVIEEPGQFVIRVALSEEAESFQLATYTIQKTPWDGWWQANQGRFDEGSLRAVAREGPFPTMLAEALTSSCLQPDTWNNGILEGLPHPRTGFTSVWTGALLLVWGGWSGAPNSPIFLNTGSRYDPATDTWGALSTIHAPSGRSGHSVAWTGREMIVWGGENGPFTSPSYLATGGRYDPSTNSWAPVSALHAPAGRTSHTAVWTGRVMIVWGGHSILNLFEPYFESGGRYDPATDVWAPTSTVSAPIGRGEHAAVWTGREMVVWGGFRNSPPTLPDSGGRYDPVSDRWVPISTVGAPAGRRSFVFVWSGSDLIVWGGYGHDPGFYDTGGRYDPVMDTWTLTTTANAPSRRVFASAVWADGAMIVWGGELSDGSTVDTGAIYSPQEDSWRPISTINAPTPRFGHGAVWTGDLMVVWGGRQGPISQWGLVNSGGRYEPASDTWTPTSMMGAPEARTDHTAVWTGTEMIVWGGQSFNSALNTGGRYDPATDSWRAVALENAPSPRFSHTAVWTGGQMIVWGGFCGSAACGWLLKTGHRYDPNLDIWVPIPNPGFLAPRRNHTAVWAGNEMIVWGGAGFSSAFGDGGRYNPANESWAPVPAGAGSARANHTAVWTGDEMLIWGGTGTIFPPSGGARYNPAAGTWSALSHLNEPSPRSGHSAVWTGREMIVWGGYGDLFNSLNTGGRYDPAADNWSTTSMMNAPGPRGDHSAVWTGNAMIVWGKGRGCTSFSNLCPFDGEIGSRYEPSVDSWTRISALGAPGGRFDHTAVWTGTRMFLWGGDGGGFPLDTGGGYVADAVLQPPIAHAGLDQTVECGGPEGTRVSLIGTASTCRDASLLTYTWNGPFFEGGGTIQISSPTVTLPLGASTITLTVTDDLGQGATDSVIITVVDGSPPSLTCPVPLLVECAGPAGTPIYLLQAAVADSCDAHPVVSNSFTSGGADASGLYALGTTIVTFTATDVAGNKATCKLSVQVGDTTPPSLTLTASPTTLWPPNHRLVPVQATWQTSDVCDPSVGVVLASATSSEPDDAPASGDGNTTEDMQDASIGTPDKMVLLRAERAGDGPGRIYTLTYAATDASGNASSALGLVTVPHDLGTGPEPVMMSLEGDGTPGMAHLYWNAVSGAELYDVIQGDVNQITQSNGKIWLGLVHVLATGQGGTGYSEGLNGALPPPGSAFFYLVQYRDTQSASGWGTESSSWPAEPVSCDVGCPGEVATTSVASSRPLRR